MRSLLLRAAGAGEFRGRCSATLAALALGARLAGRFHALWQRTGPDVRAMVLEAWPSHVRRHSPRPRWRAHGGVHRNMARSGVGGRRARLSGSSRWPELHRPSGHLDAAGPGRVSDPSCPRCGRELETLYHRCSKLEGLGLHTVASTQHLAGEAEQQCRAGAEGL